MKRQFTIEHFIVTGATSEELDAVSETLCDLLRRGYIDTTAWNAKAEEDLWTLTAKGRRWLKSRKSSSFDN